MKRREFIKAGAATATVAGAAGIGGAVGSACGGLFEGNSFDVGRIPLPNMDDYLRKVDDGMRRIAEWDRRDDIPETELDRALENELGKKALRALYMAGMFGDLPDAGQVHPGMQERVRRAMPEMGEAVADMAELLSNVSEEDAEALRRYLNEKDNPGMEIAQWFDEVESALGVSARRRRQTRAFITQAVTRLKNQPPRLLFDEYVGKVERVAAQAGSPEEMERRLIARMGKDAFFERQQRLAMYAAAWEEAGVTAEDVPVGDLPPVELPEVDEKDAGAAFDVRPGDESTLLGDAGQEELIGNGKDRQGDDRQETGCQELFEKWNTLVADRQKGLVTASVYQRRVANLRSRLLENGCIGGEVTDDQEQRRDTDRARHDRYDLARDGLSARQRKKKLLRAGWWSFGVGSVVMGISLPITFLVDYGMVSGWFATAGAVLFLIGLIMLIVVGINYRNV